ncbi:MAG: hypothetical protein E7554_05950 [Ruminococcaceae bacterium]|nr:hypothetical protein [Oscillospiraceae bacterium]
MSKISINTNVLWDIGKAAESIQKSLTALAEELKARASSLNIFEDILQWTDERISSEAKQIQKQSDRCGMAASYLFKMAENYEAAERTLTGAINLISPAISSTREENDRIYPTSTDWIPPVMQLDGTSPEEIYLRNRITQGNIKWQTKWDQEKINSVWAACELIYKEHGVQIDPRILIAIIIQEGNGSFNTSSTNRAADGEHGYEANVSKDLARATDLIFRKVLGYIQYGEEFNNTVAESLDTSGNFIQYLNWETPILKLNDAQSSTGVYASDTNWSKNVCSIYERFVGSDTAVEDYTNYLLSLDKSYVTDNVSHIPDYDFVPLKNTNGQCTNVIAK